MHWQFGEMEFGEMKRNPSNWSNFGMLLRRAGLTASAGLSCFITRIRECKPISNDALLTQVNAVNEKYSGIARKPRYVLTIRPQFAIDICDAQFNSGWVTLCQNFRVLLFRLEQTHCVWVCGERTPQSN